MVDIRFIVNAVSFYCTIDNNNKNYKILTGCIWFPWKKDGLKRYGCYKSFDLETQSLAILQKFDLAVRH